MNAAKVISSLAGALFVFGAYEAAAHDMSDMPGMAQKAKPPKLSFGEPGAAAKADRTVTVTMNDMSFEPSSLRVAAGETIRFAIVNKSMVDHDFTIGDESTQKEHRAEMAEMAKNSTMEHHRDPNAVLVKAGETKELIWKFTRIGAFEFDCDIPGHYEAGMKGLIAVTAKSSRATTGSNDKSSRRG
jgi:uncharacterized cupredoxin-like copper-binding protein